MSTDLAKVVLVSVGLTFTGTAVTILVLLAQGLTVPPILASVCLASFCWVVGAINGSMIDLEHP